MRKLDIVITVALILLILWNVYLRYLDLAWWQFVALVAFMGMALKDNQLRKLNEKI